MAVDRAIDGFDFTDNNEFATYAQRAIRTAMQRAIDNQASTIRIPVHVKEMLRTEDAGQAQPEGPTTPQTGGPEQTGHTEEQSAVEGENAPEETITADVEPGGGTPPSSGGDATQDPPSGGSTIDLLQARKTMCPISANAVTSGTDEKTLGDTFSDTVSDGPIASAEETDNLQFLLGVIDEVVTAKVLTERDAQIFLIISEVSGETSPSYKELGTRFGISHTAVGNAYHKAARKISEYIQEHYPAEYRANMPPE